ncbi:RBBP9/YdeN family alpha/beta hydrolase [Roseateles koreensis]|uniref:Alpha/beta hydrolase n=1 Tax=Roseateles koreensis TaxID=2987526 RepID=A0ABT5KUQ7_9BURK|nr:alpha/beta hydrolase [Roseateles koreensis]MDC8786541.1 alpha/beta hydrolase [Roseateles koreensis]
MKTPPIYLLPGWLNSDPDHWQSRWETALGHSRVEQSDWEWPRRGDWMARLDEVLLGDARLNETPAVLVAHSLGCQLVASWAAHSQHTARVAGALLVAPPDSEHPQMPPQLHNWRPIARQRLPFPSVAVISTDDPFCAPDRAAEMAAAWGAKLLVAGPLGHLNSASGLGDWPEGQALLAELSQSAGPVHRAGPA